MTRLCDSGHFFFSDISSSFLLHSRTSYWFQSDINVCYYFCVMDMSKFSFRIFTGFFFFFSSSFWKYVLVLSKNSIWESKSLSWPLVWVVSLNWGLGWFKLVFLYRLLKVNYNCLLLLAYHFRKKKNQPTDSSQA